MIQTKYLSIFTICTSAALMSSATLSSEQEVWEFGASINGWFPDISGQTSFTPPGGGGDFEIGIDQILDNLEFTLQGTFDARKGKGGVLVDMVYMGVSMHTDLPGGMSAALGIL